MAEDPVAELGKRWEWFAKYEASGRSALYAAISYGVAGDRELLAHLAELPVPKRQPNLVLAAVRHVCGLAEDFAQFRDWYLEHRARITAVILARRTQTNEPARCATLMPLLATLPQPLALIEVGTAAGLCLLIGRYRYDYGTRTIGPAVPGLTEHGGDPDAAPRFRCRTNLGTPLPERPLEVAWRAGLDLNPIDVRDPDQVAWLEDLVWPGEGARLELLRAAIALARRDPPRIVRGDLRRDLPALVAQAPRDATVVVFHTAVLAYIADQAERLAFGERVRALGARWVANEGPPVLGLAPPPDDDPWPSGDFVLALDREPVARTDPHGTWIEWL